MLLGRVERAPKGTARAAWAVQALSARTTCAQCQGLGNTWISLGKLQDMGVTEQLLLSSLTGLRRKAPVFVVVFQE